MHQQQHPRLLNSNRHYSNSFNNRESLSPSLAPMNSRFKNNNKNPKCLPAPTRVAPSSKNFPSLKHSASSSHYKSHPILPPRPRLYPIKIHQSDAYNYYNVHYKAGVAYSNPVSYRQLLSARDSNLPFYNTALSPKKQYCSQRLSSFASKPSFSISRPRMLSPDSHIHILNKKQTDSWRYSGIEEELYKLQRITERQKVIFHEQMSLKRLKEYYYLVGSLWQGTGITPLKS